MFGIEKMNGLGLFTTTQIIKLFEVEGGVIRRATRIGRINCVDPEWGYEGANRLATHDVRINCVNTEWDYKGANRRATRIGRIKALMRSGVTKVLFVIQLVMAGLTALIRSGHALSHRSSNR
jgi:hypothetical protein